MSARQTVADRLDQVGDPAPNKPHTEAARRLDVDPDDHGVKFETIVRYARLWRQGEIGDTHADSEPDDDTETLEGDEEGASDVEFEPDLDLEEGQLDDKGLVGVNADIPDAVYDEDEDVYYVAIDALSEGLSQIRGDVVRELKRMYSREVGEAATINAIADALGWPYDAAKKFKRAMGWTHDDYRYTREEFQRHDDIAELAESTVRAKRVEYAKAKREHRRERDREDAEKWRRFDQTVKEPILEGLAGAEVPELDSIDAPAAGDVLGLAMPADGHLDQLNADGTGWAVNVERWIACHVRTLEAMVERAGGRPEAILLVLGNDQANIDSRDGRTTSGTPQDNDLRPEEGARRCAEGSMKTIYAAAERAQRVVVAVVPGNHDWRWCQMLTWGLEGHTEGFDGVKVLGPPHARQYVQWGRTMIALTHGDEVSSAAELAKIASNERPRMWGRTDWRYGHIGHEHHHSAEDDGIWLEAAPTSAKPDRWHDRSGYVSPISAQLGWLYHRERGRIGRACAALPPEVASGKAVGDNVLAQSEPDDTT